MISSYIMTGNRASHSSWMTKIVRTLVMACIVVPSSIRVSAQSEINGNNISLPKIIGTKWGFALLSFLVENSGIQNELEKQGSGWTMFGPVDDSFSDFGEELLTNLLTEEQWRFHLTNFLENHIVGGKKILSDDIVIGSTEENLLGETVTFTTNDGGDILVNGTAKILGKLDVPQLNGIIHAIDTVLTPAWIDMNIANILDSNPNRFSTLTNLADEVDSFVEKLSSTPTFPYTLFAPTNDAFSKSGVDFENNLDAKFLEDILGFHLVPGIYTAHDLINVGEVQTESRQMLTFEADPTLQTLSVNGQPVIRTNVLANNGITHVLGGVLLPDGKHNVVNVDPELYDDCLVLKALEENRGASFGVMCMCSKVGNLTCSEESGDICTPKYGQCETSSDCCSAPLRRCASGQCRDSTQQDRVKIGSEAGGASARSQRNNGSGN